MNGLRVFPRNSVLTFVVAVLSIGASTTMQAQGPGGRRGLPGATPEQNQAVVDMNSALDTQISAVAAARAELATATFASTKNESGIKAAIEKVRTAELTLATARATEFSKLQASPNKLNADQVKALIAAGGNLAVVRGPGGPAPTAPATGAARSTGVVR